MHSQTGTTLRFAKIIAERLQSAGHETTLTELKTDIPVAQPVKKPWPFRLSNLGDYSNFDAILLGGPVWAFGPSPVVMATLEEVPLQGKLFVPFVTMALPLTAFGGRRAIHLMRAAAAAKGAHTLDGFVAPMLLRRQGVIMERAASYGGSLA